MGERSEAVIVSVRPNEFRDFVRPKTCGLQGVFSDRMGGSGSLAFHRTREHSFLELVAPERRNPGTTSQTSGSGARATERE